MKERLLTNWTFTRMIYIVLGGFIIAQSIEGSQWLGIVAGVYFAAMGLFAFGCAAGNCIDGNCTVAPEQKSKTIIQEY